MKTRGERPRAPKCALGRFIPDPIEGFVKTLDGEFDRYSGAGIIPATLDQAGNILSAIGENGGRFTPDYEFILRVDKEVLFLRPRKMKDKEVNYMIDYLLTRKEQKDK